MGSPKDDEYKPKMTRMAFCPDFDDDDPEVWAADDENADEDNSESNVSSSDDGNGVVVVDNSVVQVPAGSIQETSEENEVDELTFYEHLESVAIDVKLLLKYPLVEDLKFEISCGSCSRQAGPPVNCCTSGHVICDFCLEKGKTSCDSLIAVSPEEGIIEKCNAGFVGIDAAIQNTPYYKEFMASCRFNCGLKELGCDALLSGLEIERHDLLECPFRFIRNCRFRSDGCTSTFMDLKENVEHLILDHDLPVWDGSQANFFVKYNPNGLPEDAPNIRAALEASDEHSLCLLITENVENDKTRLWFLKVFWDDENDNPLTAVICIYPPNADENNLEDIIPMKLCVVPDVKNVGNLTGTDSVTGCKYYVDLDNNMLNEYSFEKDGKNYFGMMVVIVEHMQKSEPTPTTNGLPNNSELERLKEEIAVKMELVRELEAYPPVKHYTDLAELDAESERKDTVKRLKEEIMDLVLYAEHIVENDELKAKMNS